MYKDVNSSRGHKKITPYNWSDFDQEENTQTQDL